MVVLIVPAAVNLQPLQLLLSAAVARHVLLLLSTCLKLHDLLGALLIQYPVSTLTALNRLSWFQLGTAPTAATDIVAC